MIVKQTTLRPTHTNEHTDSSNCSVWVLLADISVSVSCLLQFICNNCGAVRLDTRRITMTTSIGAMACFWEEVRLLEVFLFLE